MKKGSKADGRNREIVTFYYIIFTDCIHKGMNNARARKEATDAVSLRYGISPGRTLNIITEQKASPNANIVTLRRDAEALIARLEEVNKGMEEERIRNEKLISVLKVFADE